MEATLSDILEQVGGLLADAVGARLREHGLPEAVEFVRSQGRVTVASRSRQVRVAEIGTVEQPPRAALQGAAREVEASLVAHIARGMGIFTL